MERDYMDGKENIYFASRKKAAEYNDKLNSREAAAEMLGFSPSTLANDVGWRCFSLSCHHQAHVPSLLPLGEGKGDGCLLAGGHLTVVHPQAMILLSSLPS